MADKASELVPMDLIYTGARQGEKGPVASMIPINPANGERERERCFTWSAKWKKRAVGGLYRGAKFSATQMLAGPLDFIHISGTETERWNWRAHHELAMRSDSRAKIEERFRKSDEIAHLMLPLRRHFQRASFYDQQAIEQMFLAALHKPLTAEEAKNGRRSS